MKILASLERLPSRATEPAVRPASTANASFGELLRKNPDRAFGFSELGVLGTQTPTHATPGQPSRPAAPTTSATSGTEYIPALAQSPTPTEQPQSPHIRTSALAPHDPRPAVAVSDPANTGYTDIHATTVTGCSLTERAPGGDDAPAANNRAADRRRVHTPPANKLSLVLREENGLMQIVAGSPEIGPQARARLRKAAAALAAEFGVTLAEFTLNGLDLQPPLKIGAPHGDRTR